MTSVTSSQWNNSFGEVISYAHFHLRAVTEVVDLLIDFFNWVQKKVTYMYHDVKNLHNVLLLSVYCSCLSANYGCLYYQYTIYLQLSLSVVSFISIHELSTCSCLCHLLTKSTAAVFINLLQLSLSICCSCLCQSTAAVFVKLLQLSLSVYCSCLYQCTAVVSFISILSTYSCPCPSTYEICCTCLCQSIAAVL